jgi:hypothetical protein
MNGMHDGGMVAPAGLTYLRRGFSFRRSMYIATWRLGDAFWDLRLSKASTEVQDSWATSDCLCKTYWACGSRSESAISAS